MARVTLADVARAAGVDMSTASRVLRGESSQRVREETRDRILKIAADLQYLANPLARGLRTQRTDTLGIVVPQLDNPVFASAIRGAELAAAKLGYSLLISHREPGATATTIAKISQTNRVDGLLVASLDDDEVLRTDLAAARVPFVLMNRILPGAPLSVVLDSRAAARKAVDHLTSLGHRRIVHLAGRSGGFNARERLQGYRDGLEAAGIPFDESLVAVAGYTAEGGADAMRALLAARPTAVLAATLVSAAGAMATLHEAGLRIPEDVSVTGLHDAPVAGMLYPPLTSVAMPTEEMGRVAATLLIRSLAGETPDPVAPLPPGALVIRRSTGPTLS
ncbi:MAG: LacI family transcriptional regulator [Azorhizobium sp. 32-67-21]|nr:MAG: LacI family transcriptional regulator [Rhizobiales bacterium 12-68-15]OYX90061.1 MAG: LacI family transcriptional regulator [Azorhizobium sp. 32-67-21]OYY12897.1 MAG: LacI family transcriptional regulator [Rhizobiales bacterium 35-68-8]